MAENMIPLYLIMGIVIVVVLFQVVRAVARLLDPNYRRTMMVRRMAKAHLQKIGCRKIKFDETNVLHDNNMVYYVGFQNPDVTVNVNLASGKCKVE